MGRQSASPRTFWAEPSRDPSPVGAEDPPQRSGSLSRALRRGGCFLQRAQQWALPFPRGEAPGGSPAPSPGCLVPGHIGPCRLQRFSGSEMLGDQDGVCVEVSLGGAPRLNGEDMVPQVAVLQGPCGHWLLAAAVLVGPDSVDVGLAIPARKHSVHRLLSAQPD